MKQNNKQAFESATRGLLNQLDSMKLPDLQRMQAKNFVLLFRDSFKQDDVKYATFADTIGEYYNKMPYDSYGFCKAASCSFVTLMNSPDWKLMYINEVWAHGPHYYVMHAPTKTVFDLTFDQYVYDGVEIPYYMGRPTRLDAESRDVMKRFMGAVGLDTAMIMKKLRKNRKD